MRIRVAVPVAIALLLGAAGCGAWGDDDAELDAANAACNAMAQHRYTAAARRVNEAVVEDARWRDLAWAIRAIAYDWQSIGPNPPYPPREEASAIVQEGCSDAAAHADAPPFVWSP